MADASLRYTLSARDLSSDVLKKASRELDSYKARTEASFKKIAAAAATGAAAFYGLQRAWGMVSGYVNDSVKAYGEQEQAEAQLRQALGKTNQTLLDQASALQKTTTFSDDAIVGAQSMVAMFIKEESQIKKLTPAILDFAAAKGMDLKSAADLVTKSIASGTNALKRYGIDIEGAAGSTERAESAVRALESAFKGQAEAIANTDFGKLEQQKNLLNDVQEKLGKEIVPLQTEWNKLMLTLAESIVPKLSKALDDLVTTQQEARQSAMAEISAQLEAERAELEAQIKLAKTTNQTSVALMAGNETRIVSLRVAIAELDALNAQIQANKRVGEGSKTAPREIIEGAGKAGKEITPDKTAPFQKWWEEDLKAQEKAYNDAVALQEKQHEQVLSAQYAFEESKIQLGEDEYQRERDLLILKQQQEMSDLYGNYEAQEVLKKTHDNQMLFLEQDIQARKTDAARKGAEDRKKIRDMEEAATWRSVDSSLAAAMTMVEIAGREKDELKPIYIALAVMRAASSTVQAVQAAWETANGNYFVGAALTAAAVIENVALLAGQISAIRSAAHGADFVTQGPQLMLVGDNPSGREHVKVTPAENNRTFNDSGNVSINLNISGNADRQTIDYSIQQLQSFSKQYKRAKYEGMLA